MVGGAISTGRPLSNSASSSVASASEASFSAARPRSGRRRGRAIRPQRSAGRPPRAIGAGALRRRGFLGSDRHVMAAMKSRTARAATRRSWPSRSSVRSTSDETEKPISPPNTTAYSVVSALRPITRPSNLRAANKAVSSTGVAVPSPTTVNKVLMPAPFAYCSGMLHSPLIISKAAAKPNTSRCLRTPARTAKVMPKRKPRPR